MNYTQIIAEIEQLKIGKNKVDTDKILHIFQKLSSDAELGEIIYLPQDYEYDSIGNYCEMILKSHKYVVGRFTSYGLKLPCEYIFVNGKAISQKQLTVIGERIIALEEFGQGKLTQIEVYLLIALFYFAKEKCQYIFLPHSKADMANFSVEEVTMQKRTLAKQCFSIDKYKVLEVSVASKIEVQNSAIAILLLEKAGIALKEKIVRKALLTYKGEGKFEVLKSKPYFIIDGANNGRATRLLMANLQYYFPENPYIFIVGTLQEEYEEIVKESVLMAWQVITVTPPERMDALPAFELAKHVEKLNSNITNVSSVEEAVELAKLLASRDTVVVAFGSSTWLDKYKKTVVT